MTLQEWFNKGLTTEEYLAGMNVNKDEMMGIYSKYTLSSEEKEKLQPVKDQGLKVIVLTEDWCGDAMLNNPVLLKIAEEIGMEVRFILRDSNLELMDQYLTNGTSRAIPIFVFLNSEGEEVAVWGPRAPKLQELVISERSKLPNAEADDFKDEQAAMYKRLTASYQEDENHWHTVADSIIEKLV
ncbi:MAG: thioredoxin family protein [Bacillus anthracis]|uniref:thioredoxin family protein n=1 Tax=Cytobacillus gottheilii TaxID=859144 RepID=UPI0008312359|nr:thioredoxin family protein [Cytobacillus gottheilii]